MKVMITGANGQVGTELQRTAPLNHHLIVLDRKTLDITDATAVNELVNAHKPDVLVNTAAYTAVDKAEEEPDTAFAVNAVGARNIAKAVKNYNTKLVHISTDFVFGGEKSSPYSIEDQPNPLNVYGKSKLLGEQYVFEDARDQVSIVRTSWVYSVFGKNFVNTMLRLMRDGKSLRVVKDQIGTPTWAMGLAIEIWEHIKAGVPAGLFHWSYSGAVSWYNFAEAIQEEALRCEILSKPVEIIPVSGEEYGLPALRPAYSVLNVNFNPERVSSRQDWRQGLRGMLDDLKKENTKAKIG